MTPKDVILNEGCLAAEGEQDETRKMKQQLEKLNALLRIPYEDTTATRQIAVAKTKIAGIS